MNSSFQCVCVRLYCVKFELEFVSSYPRLNWCNGWSEVTLQLYPQCVCACMCMCMQGGLTGLDHSLQSCPAA